MCHNQRVFQTLINEVGAWSAENFGYQESKWEAAIGSYPDDIDHPRWKFARQQPGEVPGCMQFPSLALDHVAPLLGIIEETGELEEAMTLDNKELIRDSIGDIQIYLADYLFRTGLTADIIGWSDLHSSNFRTVFLSREMLITVGKLAHINLKRHQGIRGYDGPKFFQELGIHLTYLMILLRLSYIQSHPKPLDPENPLATKSWTPEEATDAIITIASNTWEHVKQRNWKKNAVTGS